jgi:tetratricopeptide (TPR) repeat protein
MAEENSDSGSSGGSFTASAILAAASREKADAFVDKQNELADLQIEDLKRENRVRHWSLRVRHISDVLKLGFEMAVAFIVIAIAVGFGFEIWAAMHADGLVIDAFTVPPSMADKGLTGQVVASKLLDRLAVLQSETQSSRAASSFSNDWTNDIKVEIPDTGVSLGQVVRFLHTTLGHESHLSGEMYQTPTGAALTVRMDSDAGQTFNASSGDLDALIERAALAVYAHAQPYRYSVYLALQGKVAESYAVDKALVDNGPASERPWGLVGMANNLQSMGRFEEQRRDALLAHQANPDLVLPAVILVNADNNAGHDEATMREGKEVLRLLQGGGEHGTTQKWRDYARHTTETAMRELSGDYRAASETMSGERWFQPVFITAQSALDLAFAHDPKDALANLHTLPPSQLTPSSIDASNDTAALALALVAMGRGDRQAAIEALSRNQAITHAFALNSHGTFSDRNSHDQLTAPWLAVLYAQQEQWSKAEAQLKGLPDDCDICVRARGNVEAVRGNWAAAERWFALVSARSPSIPFADTDWGRMLMAKGDLDGAIAKFESAHVKGPHYADPLEMWGEVLIAKNRSDLALAKFEEANKYAPNWGRLHLKWGEALWWLGKKDEAKKQFALAATLELTPPEKAERARFS